MKRNKTITKDVKRHLENLPSRSPKSISKLRKKKNVKKWENIQMFDQSLLESTTESQMSKSPKKLMLPSLTNRIDFSGTNQYINADLRTGDWK